MNATLRKLIQDYIDDFNQKQSLEYVVTPSIPIVWFGDLERYMQSKKKVVTIGLNPSLKEFEGNRFDTVDMKAANAVTQLADVLNAYFKRNPYMGWFNSFENILPAVDASYHVDQAANTALHIDIYSAIATNPTWGRLDCDQKAAIRRTDLFKQLLAILHPDVIVFSANQAVFNEVFAVQFKYKCGNENINGRRGMFIKRYFNGSQTLISGRNLRGTPFGGMSQQLARETIRQLMATEP